jgi:hypothetical protein
LAEARQQFMILERGELVPLEIVTRRLVKTVTEDENTIWLVGTGTLSRS